MKGLTKIFSKLYDKALYHYFYMWIVIDQWLEGFADFRANVRWIKEHGKVE